VLIYRGAGIINFANGAIGTLSAFTYWECEVNRGLPAALSAIIALVVAGLAGYLTHQFALRPMKGASVLTRSVVTLAVLVIIESGLTLHYGPNAVTASSLLPTDTLTIFGVRIGEDRVILFAISAVLTLGLYIVYSRTRFGLATSASVENVRAASSLGISPNSLARSNWIIGSLLAGVAGILLAPIIGIQIQSLTELIVPALAAALIGGLSSFGLTFLGGLIIGVSQAEVTAYVSVPGWSTAIPFILILIALAIRGTGLGSRSRSKLREFLPRVTTGRVSVLKVLLATVFVGVLIEWVLSVEYIQAVTITLSFGIILLSSVVVTGFAGQLSLCQYSFAGIGAVIAGRLVGDSHLPFVLGVIIAIVVTFPIGFLIGLPVLRTRGVSLGVATLGLALTIQAVLFSNSNYTGGQILTVSSPRIFGLDVGALVHPQRWAILCLICFVVLGIAVANLRRGRAGRRFLAVRANERAAQSLGINPYATKLFALSMSASIAAVGGILVVFQYDNLVFGTGFDPFSSINGLTYSVIGGIGYVLGPIFGGLGQPGGIISTLFGSSSTNVPYWLALVGGVLAIMLLQKRPEGAVPLIRDQLQWLWDHLIRHSTKRSNPTVLPDAAALPKFEPVAPQSLIAEGITVRYGGVIAVSEVSIKVAPGEILGVIGPNGSGKSSLIDALSGALRKVGGEIALGDHRLNGMPMHGRARLGLTRSFQSVELFDDMTVSENLLVAIDSRHWWRYFTDLVWPGKVPASPDIAAAVSAFELTDDLDTLPTEMPYGRRRLVSIARAVVCRPSILCLDEPAAGLSSGESEEVGRLLRRLVEEFGMGLLLVEHDVDLIMGVCDRIAVLDFGQVIAEGTPDEIRRNPAVQKAYLGVASEPVNVGSLD
jgi:ABC-type branched-subunit amino acid transport system ATPase component/branched-subunit amino acid ABC-type transport system permease component